MVTKAPSGLKLVMCSHNPDTDTERLIESIPQNIFIAIL